MKFFNATIATLAFLTSIKSSVCGSISISMEDFNQVLTSDVFEHLSGVNKQQKWEELTKVEWMKAQDEEEKHQIKYPFMICHSGVDMSGFKRRQSLESVIGFNTDMSVASNTESQTCFFESMFASLAAEISNIDNVAVQPVLPSMKIRANTIENVRDRVDRHRGYLHTYPKEVFEDELPEGFDLEISLCSMANDDDLDEAGSHHILHIIQEMNQLEECSLMYDTLEVHLAHSKKDLFVTVPLTDMISSMESEHPFENSSKINDDVSRCAETLVSSISHQPEVCSVEIIPEMEFLNNEAQWILQSGTQDYRPFYDAGLSGAGQVVSVSDSGLDVDNCYFWDSTGDIEIDGSVDQSRRKVVQYTPFADGGDRKYGHGTHVCGTIVGHKAVDGSTESHGLADGTAKNAKVSFYDIGRRFLPLLKLPRELNTLLAEGKKADANIHSASWGSATSAYDSSAAQFDKYAFDNPDHLALIAAGNSGSGNRANSIGSPATAKNVISVGASHSSGIDLTPNQKSEDYVASFSSRGPTDDGRTKPDIVAPGYSILSAGAVPRKTGECDPNSIDNISPPSGSKEGLTFMAGTSMATPATSGTAALVRQYMEEGWFPSSDGPNPDNAVNPSGALVKAILLNGGQSMIAVDNGASPNFPVKEYDNIVNYGRVNLLDSLPLSDHNDIGAWMTDRKSIDDGEIDTWTIKITECDDATEARVTLVWMDPPASSGCRFCVLNNLDLTVNKNDSTEDIFPNGLSGPDSDNNVERIRIPVVADDEITVNVKATNLSTASQDYAMVITGCMVSEPCVNCEKYTSNSFNDYKSVTRSLRNA